jgi:hypothetical protein
VARELGRKRGHHAVDLLGQAPVVGAEQHYLLLRAHSGGDALLARLPPRPGDLRLGPDAHAARASAPAAA